MIRIDESNANDSEDWDETKMIRLDTTVVQSSTPKSNNKIFDLSRILTS